MNWRTLLYAFAVPMLSCGAGFTVAQLEGLSASIIEDTMVEASNSHYRIKKSSSPGGSLVLIANRTGQPLRVSNSKGMDAMIDTDETTSWGCLGDDYLANFILETPEGYLIASPELACGDTIQVIVED